MFFAFNLASAPTEKGNLLTDIIFFYDRCHKIHQTEIHQIDIDSYK